MLTLLPGVTSPPAPSHLPKPCLQPSPPPGRNLPKPQESNQISALLGRRPFLSPPGGAVLSALCVSSHHLPGPCPLVHLWISSHDTPPFPLICPLLPMSLAPCLVHRRHYRNAEGKEIKYFISGQVLKTPLGVSGGRKRLEGHLIVIMNVKASQLNRP